MRSLCCLLVVAASAAPVLAQTPNNSSAPIVRDFMADIPQLDEAPFATSVQALGHVWPVHMEQLAYHRQRRHAIAHSFIRGRNGQEIGERALQGFTAECIAKGGYLEPHDSAPYKETVNAMVMYSYSNWTWENARASYQMKMEVCSADPARSLGVLTVIHSRSPRRSAIVLFGPGAVQTQATIDEQARLAREQQERRAQQIGQEWAEFVEWRRTAGVGEMTGCGRIISARDDIVEVALRRDGTSRWIERRALQRDGYGCSL